MYSVVIKIDKNNDGEYEKERHLKLDFAAIVEIDRRLQTKYNKDFMQVLQDLTVEHFNFDCLVDIYWLGLIHEDPKLTRPRLIRLISDVIADQHYDIADIVTFITEAGIKSGVLVMKKQDETVEDEEKSPLEQESG